MKTYSVKPEGINPIKKRMLMFGAAALVIVLASFGTVLPGGLTPLDYGFVTLFVVLFGGFGFHRALRRRDETWPSYTLTMTDDSLLKQQSHYPDIRIARDEVKAIEQLGSRLSPCNETIHAYFMQMTQPALFSRLLRFGFSLLVLCICAAGCASFPGKSLPPYTYDDLAPAPEDAEKKVCLVMSDTGSVSDEEREAIDTTVAMLEKSGFFLKAPERCTWNGEKLQNRLKWDFRNDLKAGNLAVAFISGFISGYTLTLLPAYARDEFIFTVQIRVNDALVKEYVYREHVNSWIHLTMLFMMSDHRPRAAIKEIYYRSIMNFLYDYSRDMQPSALAAAVQ